MALPLGELARERLRGRARCPAENPFRLLPLVAATFPKGTALVVAGNFVAALKGAPLGELSRSD